MFAAFVIDVFEFESLDRERMISTSHRQGCEELKNAKVEDLPEEQRVV